MVFGFSNMFPTRSRRAQYKVSAGSSTNESPLNHATDRRVFVYLICISRYRATKVPNLHACVEDGKKLREFLRTKFRDQSLHIKELCNEKATHDSILSLFEDALSDPSIRGGDLVIFFYAGHGSRTQAPKGWSTGDDQIETICPHDVDTKKRGKNVYGIPDFVVGTVMRNLAIKREANVLLIFDSCHSAGMARSKTRYLVPRYSDSNPIDEEHLNNLLKKYPEQAGLLRQKGANSLSPFTLLAACGIDETAHEETSGGRWKGLFIDALITLLNTVPWHNLSYATLCKSLPNLPYQTPACIGEGTRIIFSLERAKDDGFHFAIEPSGNGYYTVKGAGLTLGIGVGTTFTIRGPESQDLGTLTAESVRASQCRARAELPENHQGGIPGAKAFLHHWCLGGKPLQVAFGSGIGCPNTTNSFEIVDQHSEANVVVTKRGDTLELSRQDSFVAHTTGISTVELPKNTDETSLEDILDRVARFHRHLLRKSPETVKGGITLELCQVEEGDDGRYRMLSKGPESGSHVMHDRVVLRFRPEARYGILIKNDSQHILYPYLFYFDPSDYSIHSVYSPERQGNSPIAAQGGKLPIGYGSSLVEPLELYLKDEEYSVGYIRLFVSTVPVSMDIIQQPPITQAPRHMRVPRSSAVADTGVWGVRTIVLRVERNATTDIFAQKRVII